MNNLFISLYTLNDKFEVKNILSSKKDYYKFNILKYSYTSDMLNSNYGKNMSLKLDLDYVLNNISKNKSKSLKKYSLKHDIKKDINDLSSINVIFDNIYDELDDVSKEEIKDYIYDVLNANDINIKEVFAINQMNKNYRKYIEEYMQNKKISINKVKILVILNNIDDYDEERIKEYICSYKYVDILKMPNIDKTEMKRISESIDNINKEYGSTIDIVSKKNIQEYNIYIMCSDVLKDYFFSHYVIRKNSLYIEMKNEDFDKFNVGIKEFENNKTYIYTLANRLDMDIKRYSKNKLGFAFSQK